MRAMVALLYVGFGLTTMAVIAVAYFAMRAVEVRRLANQEHAEALQKLEQARVLATRATARLDAAKNVEASAQEQLLQSELVLAAAQREREARLDPKAVLRDLLRNRQRWPDGRFKSRAKAG